MGGQSSGRRVSANIRSQRKNVRFRPLTSRAGRGDAGMNRAWIAAPDKCHSSAKTLYVKTLSDEEGRSQASIACRTV